MKLVPGKQSARMKSKLVLGVDCGAQGLRTGLFDAGDGALLASATTHYPTARPDINWDGQDAESWWTALCETVPQCLSRAGVRGTEIAALACDGTSCTVVFSDEKGIPLRPAILWMDIKAAQEAEEVRKTGHGLYEEYFDIYRAVYSQTLGTMHRLAANNKAKKS